MDIKSDQTKSAGQRLLDSGFYTQSIHCWYYAVIQKAKYKLAHCKQKPLPYEEQEKNNSRVIGFSHDWLKFEICNRIPNKKQKNIFDEDFSILKENRVDADYKQRVFSQEEAADCKDMCERMAAVLRCIK